MVDPDDRVDLNNQVISSQRAESILNLESFGLMNKDTYAKSMPVFSQLNKLFNQTAYSLQVVGVSNFINVQFTELPPCMLDPVFVEIVTELQKTYPMIQKK